MDNRSENRIKWIRWIIRKHAVVIGKSLISFFLDKKMKQKKSIPIAIGRIKRLPSSTSFVGTREIFNNSLKSRNSPQEFNNSTIVLAQTALIFNGTC